MSELLFFSAVHTVGGNQNIKKENYKIYKRQIKPWGDPSVRPILILLFIIMYSIFTFFTIIILKLLYFLTSCYHLLDPHFLMLPAATFF